MTVLLIIVGVLLLPVLYNFLFPLKPPYLYNYFTPGQTFKSKWEGVQQLIIKQEGNKVFSEVSMKPGSKGPPEHLHEGFDENMMVKKGTLTVKLNGQTRELTAGTRFRFPKGEYHCFSNNSEGDVVIGGETENDFIPVEFAYTLSKFYELFDRPSKLKMVHFIFKMAVFGNLFDSYVKEAPVKTQKIIKSILRPYARVLGYKLYDEKSKPR